MMSSDELAAYVASVEKIRPIDATEQYVLGRSHGRVIGYANGAAAAFGLMGMAFAIRRNLGYQDVRVTRIAAPISFPCSWYETDIE